MEKEEFKLKWADRPTKSSVESEGFNAYNSGSYGQCPYGDDAELEGWWWEGHLRAEAENTGYASYWTADSNPHVEGSDLHAAFNRGLQAVRSHMGGGSQWEPD